MESLLIFSACDTTTTPVTSISIQDVSQTFLNVVFKDPEVRLALGLRRTDRPLRPSDPATIETAPQRPSWLAQLSLSLTAHEHTCLRPWSLSPTTGTRRLFDHLDALTLRCLTRSDRCQATRRFLILYYVQVVQIVSPDFTHLILFLLPVFLATLLAH